MGAFSCRPLLTVPSLTVPLLTIPLLTVPLLLLLLLFNGYGGCYWGIYSILPFSWGPLPLPLPVHLFPPSVPRSPLFW